MFAWWKSSVGLFTIVTLWTASIGANSYDDSIEHRYIVEYEHSGVSIDDVVSHLATSNIKAKPRREFSHSLFSGASFHVLNGDKLDNVLQTIDDAPMIKKVWPCRYYKSASTNDYKAIHIGSGSKAREIRSTNASSEDTFAPHVMTGVDKLHAQGFTGKGLVIGMLDTGVDYLNPVLGGCFGEGCKISGGYDYVGDTTNNTIHPDNDPYSTCRPHGTFTAGIIAANKNELGFTGVVPDATILMYRLSSCGTYENAADDLINGSLAAYDAKSDIITASIAGINGFSEDPWTVVVQRINEAGTLYVLAADNYGERGAFYPSGAADGIGVTAVGSVQNIVFTELVIEGQYTAQDGQQTNFYWTPGLPNNISSGSYQVYARSFNINDPSDACKPYPSDTPDLSPFIVLIQRGDCAFETKAQNAVAAGAKYIMFYNQVGGLLDLDLKSPGIEMTGMIEHDLGVEWISIISSGKTLTLTIEDPKTATFSVITKPNNVSGGRMDIDSSWGPTFEGYSYPTVSAPGVNILSTWTGGYKYAVFSGTSLSAPFLAGVAALIKQVRGSLDARALRSILTSTAKPMSFNDGTSLSYPYLAPVVQQGGGLCDAYEAAYTTTVVDVDVISFNDTEHINSPFIFSITNVGAAAETYRLSNIGAATVYTTPAGKSIPSTFDLGSPPDLIANYASLSISPSELTLEAGASCKITVIPTIPTDLDLSRIPVYSGYIAINATSGKNNLTVPYTGIASRLRDAIIVDTSLGYPYVASSQDGAEFPVNLTANGTVPTFKVPHDNTTDTSNTSLPNVYFYLSMGCYLLFGDVISATNSSMGNKVVAGRNVVGSLKDYNPIWPRGPHGIIWTGQFDDGSWAPEGKYRFVVRAMKLFGDRDVDEDYDVGITAPFQLTYS